MNHWNKQQPMPISFDARWTSIGNTIWSSKNNLDAAGKFARTGPERCKTVWNYYVYVLKNVGLLMQVDALSYRFVDCLFVFIMFAARRKTIMEDLSPVQKCLLFLVFLKMSGRDNAWSNAKFIYFHWFCNDSAPDTITSYDIPSNNAKYWLSGKFIIPCVFSNISVFSRQCNASNC